MSKLADEVLEDYESALVWLIEVTNKLEKIELSTRQKAQIAGLTMGVSNQFVRIHKKLIDWGFLIKGGD